MAPRGRPSIMSDHLLDQHSPESSPDPLALSVDEYKPKARRKSTRVQTTPLATTSPNKRTRSLNVSEQMLNFSSPSKSMVLNTGRPGGASPWKIKVTVEAEPGSDDDRDGSPSVQRMVRTKTTTVPLKGGDGSSPVKRRGRPPKSEATPPVKPKRSGTPIRRTSKQRKSSEGVAEPSVADMSTDATTEPPKKRRGRPRKSVVPEIDATVHEDEREVTPQRQESTSPIPEGHESYSSRTMQHARNVEERHVAAVDFSGTPKNTETAKKIRQRLPTPAKPNVEHLESTSDEETVETPSESEDEMQGVISARNERTEQASSWPTDDLALDTPTPSEEEEDEMDHTVHGFDGGATAFLDDTTMLESANFSMVSVDSLPSARSMVGPSNDQYQQSPAVERPGLSIDQSYLRLQSDAARQPRRSPQHSQELTSTTSSSESRSSSIGSPPTNRVEAEETQAVDSRRSSFLPSIVPAQPSDEEAATPEIVKPVEAGQTLQGLVTPVTQPSATKSNRLETVKQDARVGDVFKGFSDGTRKQLQAGLRLGEQLAQEMEGQQMSGTLTSEMSDNAVHDAFHLAAKWKARLLTPEQQDSDILTTLQQPADDPVVQYPFLTVENPRLQLQSPARSDDAMSWRHDTPPVTISRQQTEQRLPTESVEQESPSVGEEEEQEQYEDIWQEEASRSSDELPVQAATEKSPQLQDLFDTEGPVKPVRGKIPNTWRRKSSSYFVYSDESEEQETDESPESLPNEQTVPNDKGKGKAVESVGILEQEEEDHEDTHMSTDETGVFWHQNQLNAHSGSEGSSRRSDDKLDLSLLLGGEEGLLAESSPIRTPAKKQPNFLPNSRLATLLGTPHKGSPLRHEVKKACKKVDEVYADKSILPEESELPQSSPFRTNVDISATSDVQQLRQEMEKDSDSSDVRRLREEVEAHENAYEPYNLTLHDVTEVTEPSRSHITNHAPPSSPPQVPEKSFLGPRRPSQPLFGSVKPSQSSQHSPDVAAKAASKSTGPQAVEKPTASTVSEEEPTTSPTTGLFGRLASIIWSAPQAPPPKHPATEGMRPLPKIQPWTKTHYKAMNHLYQLQKRSPTTFSPTSPPNHNNALLHSWPEYQKYVGSVWSWQGYICTLEESDIVLCAAFMSLLTLRDIEDYETRFGEKIQWGKVRPDRLEPEELGKDITPFWVAKRFATVVIGEGVRADEKRGVQVDIVQGGLTVQWAK